MSWFKNNVKEIVMLAPIIGGGITYGGNLIHDNGYNKGTIEKGVEMQIKLDTANAQKHRINAEKHHISGRAAEWKLQLDDC